MLEIKNLHVKVEGKEILRGINLKFEKGKIHALMGPNGSGKSTLANVIMGNPKYKIIKGKILFNNEDITNLSPDQRAKKGIFLSFQNPSEVEGIAISNFLRMALNNSKNKYPKGHTLTGHENLQAGKKISVLDFHKLLKEKLKLLKMPENFSERYLNQGFSGGEKKKSEILQLAILNPKIAILDETDSGLDIDALKTIASEINMMMNKDKTIIVITHYKRILEYLKPDKLFVMLNGKIALKGGKELVNQLEKKGYSWIEKK